VRIGLIPDEWFKEMYPKTGVTGPYVLFWGAVATILSKEYFVYSVDTYAQLAFLVTFVGGVKYAGPKIREFVEKLRDKKNNELLEQHESLTSEIKEKITQNEALTSMKEANTIIHKAKRENVELQLEGLYRQRLHQVYTDVKKRLDYQVAVQTAFKRLEREQAINYIIGQVNKSIGPAQVNK
jgi:F-type H+-transporting ATPase subunit b